MTGASENTDGLHMLLSHFSTSSVAMASSSVWLELVILILVVQDFDMVGAAMFDVCLQCIDDDFLCTTCSISYGF